MIASNDNNHSEPHDSGEEAAMNGASMGIGAIEAAYHDGVVAGVAAMGLIAPVQLERYDFNRKDCFRAQTPLNCSDRQATIGRDRRDSDNGMR
jgi:hypothetical protein